MGAAPSRNHGSIVIWMIGDNGDLSTPSQNMVSCYVRGDEPVVKNNGRALDYCSALAAVLGCSGLLRDEEAAFCTSCGGCVAAALRNRPPLVYMMAAGKMGIEATLVNTVSNLQKKGL